MSVFLYRGKIYNVKTLEEVVKEHDYQTALGKDTHILSLSYFGGNIDEYIIIEQTPEHQAKLKAEGGGYGSGSFGQTGFYHEGTPSDNS